ncbi:MAG: polysaccharide biosynthesis protein [Bacteriovoracaceae bacterium]|nr:polysaccharide biosynthesis protein [Bacteriovoracaceae bacterium]
MISKSRRFIPTFIFFVLISSLGGFLRAQTSSSGLGMDQPLFDKEKDFFSQEELTDDPLDQNPLREMESKKQIDQAQGDKRLDKQKIDKPSISSEKDDLERNSKASSEFNNSNRDEKNNSSSRKTNFERLKRTGIEKQNREKYESIEDDSQTFEQKDEIQKPADTTKSTIENIFFGKFPKKLSRDLKQFGYDLFSRKPSSFMPLEDVPISADYVVGPGDSFTINVWGTTNFSIPVTVRRDGTIFIPKVGAIRVWSQTFKEMTSTIEKRLLNFFSGIKVNIAFDSIRLMDVFVIGEVKQPGSYSVSSTSSPINALFHAGGPTKNGSLRNIQILRNNQVIEKVDLYDFLISGISARQKLQSQDVILVPVVGKMVAIAGNVKRPAIYEIKDPTSLFELITMAGGLTFTGQIGRLSLERVNQNKERVTKDYQIPENFSSLSKTENPKSDLSTEVADGDLIKIFPVLTTVRKTVYLRGHVKHPGSYEYKEGMKIKDLLPDFNELLPEPYTEYAQIIRTIPPLDEKQSLFVPLQQLLSGDESANMKLKEQDEVVLFSREELNLRETVSISGKINKPGTYLFFAGMRLKDLLYMAGNLKQDAYLANAEIARYKISGEELKLERLQVNLKSTLAANSSKDNPLLEPKDRVFIQGLSNWGLENYATVTGEVRFPGEYPFLPGERLSSVIERAGGFTKKAFLPGAFYTRVSVKEIQKKALKEQVAQLEEAVLQESVRPSQYLSSQDVQTFQQAVLARKEMLKKLQSSDVTGRMLIHISPLPEFKNGTYDIPLEAKDSITIPSIPSVATVQGEVYNPSSMVFVSGKTVQYYLEKAGGTTPNANNESIFVIKADGSVISRRQNRGFLLRNFYQTEIERGDSILVPKDITQFSWLNTTKDITEILFKIASTTGITITALK